MIMKMMIDKYIAKRIIQFIIYALMVIISIECIFAFLDEMEDFGVGNYGFLEALQYVVSTVPRRIYEYFPIAVLFGGLLGLGQLASHNELVVMRAVGYSIQRIFFAVMKIALLLMAFAIVLGEWIAPKTELYAQNNRAIAQNEGRTVEIDEGAWVRHGNWFIFIRDVISSHRLKNVVAFEFNEQYQLTKIHKIANASYDDGTWYFEKITADNISKESVTSSFFEQSFSDEWIEPEVLDVLAVKPETLSTPGLASYIDYLDSNQLDTGPFELAFWNKVFQPFSTFVMMFLAIPFIFGPLRSSTLGKKILVGGLTGFGFFIVNQVFGPVSLIYNFPPVLAACLPSLIFIVLGVYLLKRIY